MGQPEALAAAAAAVDVIRDGASAVVAGDHPTGAWGPAEHRDYHLRTQVAPAAVGQEMLAARVSLVARPAGDAGRAVR